MQSIAAAAATPALPSGVFAGAPAFPAALYDRAVHYTRLWGTSVPEMYTSALGLDLEQATALFRKLATDNIIATPNANGFATAISPYFKASALTQAGSETAKSTLKPKLPSGTLRQNTVEQIAELDPSESIDTREVSEASSEPNPDVDECETQRETDH